MPKPPTLRFEPSLDLSAVHAAIVVATGSPCTDAKTETALLGPTADLNTRLVSSSVEVGVFWSSLFAAVLNGSRTEDACVPALLEANCSELLVEQTASVVANRLEDCHFAFRKRFPKLLDQLKLRSGPLSERWQTFGPGLLSQATHRIWRSSPPKDWWPTKFDCYTVQPLRGGDGGFAPGSNRIWIEAMLTDADPNVSEILRLAYWILRASLARHIESRIAHRPEPTDPDDLGSNLQQSSTLPWELGCVPIVLLAGFELELYRSRELPIADAIRLWRLGDATVATTVVQWWEQWGETDAAMPVALKALDKMLDSTRPAKLRPDPDNVAPFVDFDRD